MEEDPCALSYEAIYSVRLLPIFLTNRLLQTSAWKWRKTYPEFRDSMWWQNSGATFQDCL